MPNPHDHCNFFEYKGDQDKMVKIATAILADGKVEFEGVEADRVEKMVKENDHLKPYLKKGGYPLLAELPLAFCGTYFYATEVQEATIL